MQEIIIKANSKNQMQFLENCINNDQTLYGGAAGGGKTYSIVILPLYHQFTEVSGFRMQIFRKTIIELEDNIIPLTKYYYPLAGGLFSEQKKIWYFPSGAMIRLCYMDEAETWKRYQGGNNTVQAFDEATNFHPSNFTVENWNRSDCGIKPFRVYATNPGGISHLKFKKEFVDICKPVNDGEKKYSKYADMWYQPVKAGDAVRVELKTESGNKKVLRQYIPARVFDNEDLLKYNPNYLATLMDSSPDDRRKLLEGDWELIQGQMFDTFRTDIHCIHSSEVKLQPDWSYKPAIDYGTTTNIQVPVLSRDGTYYAIAERTWIGKSREEKARQTYQFLEENNLLQNEVIGDTDMFTTLREMPNQDSAASEYSKLGIKMKQVSKSSPDSRLFRKWQVDIMKDLLDFQKDSNGLFIKRPKIYFFADKCPNLIETIPMLQRDKNNPDIIDESEPKLDHWFRALIYGIINLNPPVNKKRKEQANNFLNQTVNASSI